MRILVVGAGAIGGYFGARLAAAGRDVTFLVRPKRAELLVAHGLSVRSPKGDITIRSPQWVTEATLRGPFDLIILSCKAFDLDSAMESFARAMGPATAVLPLLNGLAHIERLQKRFGAACVLGGQAQISTTLDADGRVIHLNDFHIMGYGELDGSRSARIEAVNAALAGASFDARLSTEILQEMWEKWTFIATLAGITCLMRACLGDIEAAGGRNLTLALFNECAAIAAENGHGLRPRAGDWANKVLTAPRSTLAASMLRDVEARNRTEHEQILGDLLARARGSGAPTLELCLVHMRAAEARRSREARMTKPE
ncbi:MAG TPA: 2-dehydropantoate 2-reductase [Steroidobacteraceae bacterium]|nr:2-dehydropantoate 2-reductase [Steroidobacteraceae bacterium]